MTIGEVEMLQPTATAPAPVHPHAEAPATSLLTDQYELTMLRAALRDGVAHHDATFELFARRLPRGRRFGVVAGIGRVLEALSEFRFETGALDDLRERGVLDPQTHAYLAEFRFTGDIDAYREGELYFPHSPVLTVRAPFGQGVLLETLLLSILNHDSAIASAAARMVSAAAGRTLIEMGSRRTHEQAAVAAARAAYLAGFDATSNLQAGRRYAVPTVGTSAHAFTLAHRSEREAFSAQVAALGVSTTLLVDTYDVDAGIRTAVEVAGPALGGVRIDSGDPRTQARRARALLDELGARDTRVVLTGDMDEFTIASLAAEPVDAYGVGTKLVTGSGAPTAEMVYKLVSIADRAGAGMPQRAVAKRSSGKASLGGAKRASRLRDRAGTAVREVVELADVDRDLDPLERRLQVPVLRSGAPLAQPSLEQARHHHRRAIAELAGEDLVLSPGGPRLDATPS